MGSCFNMAFPHLKIADTIPMADNGDLSLGRNDQLFHCTSSQRMTLTGKLEDIEYTMQMDMSNTQIQAFNIKDGNLSSDGRLFLIQPSILLFLDPVIRSHQKSSWQRASPAPLIINLSPVNESLLHIFIITTFPISLEMQLSRAARSSFS